MEDRFHRRKRFVRLVWLIGIVAFIIVPLRSVFSQESNSLISPIPETSQPKREAFAIFKKEKKPDDLARKVTTVIGDSWKDYSIIVEDYTSGFAWKYSEGQIFVAASVNKVPILAVLYYLAGKGEIDLDRDITLQAADIQDYGTGSIRYTKPGTIYSVKTLAKLMIKQSDNTAAYILSNHIIGFPKLKEVAMQWGLTQTDLVKNTTSNQDIAKVFRMIYEGKITDTAHTQEMLSFLKDTEFETRLPAKLPDSAASHHKIGTEVGIIHDAGIITDGTLTYYIGVFTSGTPENAETDALIAEVSRAVYDFMK